MLTMTAPETKGSTDIGPAYHPEDADYLIRWHEHRGDDLGEDGKWRDPGTGKVIDHADYPPPKL
jgi:hypothetical protein